MTQPDATVELLEKFNEATAAYRVQSDVVAELRCNPGSDTLTAAEAALRECKRAVDSARNAYQQVSGESNDLSEFNRQGTEGLLKRRFFIAPSFEIYGGVAGLFDYGPPGCAVKNNLVAAWRQHFVVEEGMLELEASCLTPAPVLKASGHVEKFSDLMVKDVVTGECHRADHILRDHLNSLLDMGNCANEAKEEILALRERLDELTQDGMDDKMREYNVRAPETGNELSASYPFNLMFQTSIGPSGLLPGYLRPETAQGIFVNFKRLLEYVGGKLPFACAQIGLAFRNEISPKAGLLRVREFQQAEIEHFVHPDEKTHAKFGNVRDVEINMYGRNQQMSPPYTTARISIGAAVDQGLIANETLGYFIGRTSQFVEKLGMKMNHVRFRQHLEHEMAHYASDCWDLEINCSYGWIECAGLADRSAYDLGNHSEKSGNELSAREVFMTPREVEKLVCVPNKGALGKEFKKNAQVIMASIANMDGAAVGNLQKIMDSDGCADIGGFSVSKHQVSFKIEKARITGRSFYPSVIEPSFGIGRVLFCLWEHCYYVRDGEVDTDGSSVRAVLGLPASIAPVKCIVLPLSKSEVFNEMLKQVNTSLTCLGLITRVDDSGSSIGRRYARSDEVGTPFCITIDFESVSDGTVTVRERDSTKQIRCSSEIAVDIIRKLVDESTTWNEVCLVHPVIN